VNSTTYKLIACDGVLLVLGHVEVSDLDRGIGALGVGRLLGLLIVSLLVVALFGHLRLLSLRVCGGADAWSSPRAFNLVQDGEFRSG
jgi:hypothetical protein